MKDAKHTRNEVSAKPKVRGANTVESDHKQLDDRLSRLEGDMNRVLSELKQMNQATSGGVVKAHPVVKEGKPNPGSPRPGTHQSFRRRKWSVGGVVMLDMYSATVRTQKRTRSLTHNKNPQKQQCVVSKGWIRIPYI